MKRVQKQLMISFLSLILLSILLVVAGEAGIQFFTFSFRGTGHSGQAQFICQTLLEILTIGAIPLALRLFKLKKIHQELVSKPEKALLKWGQLRIWILFLPLLLNIIFYYASMAPGFGYMGIILFLCLFFIVPTKGRCSEDITDNLDKK
ncbi:MAG: hypothetical protein WCS17_06315 [Prevotella sp.]